jgi:hypothetical protein
MRNNLSNTEQWTTFVRRNPLRWDSDPVALTMQQGENRTFTARIVNTGGATVSYSIDNLPSWLTVSARTGSLQALASRELTFTINRSINVGNYETAVNLETANGVREILPVQLKVTGERPNWSVNPNDFESWMSVTGQVRIEGAPQEDEDDLLAAFIGDKCVGLISPKYEPAYQSYYVYMSVWGNSEDDQKEVTFKLWDASTGQVYPVVELTENGNALNLKFIGNDTHGTPDNPVVFNARDIIEQSIALGNGWNWISFHVENDNPTLINQFKANASGFASQLKNGAGQFINNSGGNWGGTVTSLPVTESFLTRTTRAATLTVIGKPVNPAVTPIELAAGKWSWIGYTPQFSLPVADALAGIANPRQGDQIKGQKGYRQMSTNGWIGSLSAMEPGIGYMYKSENTVDVTFTYPSVSVMLRSAQVRSSAAPVKPKWEADFYQYPNNMTVTASLSINGETMNNGIYEIAAFSQNECRGSALLEYIEGFKNPLMGFLMIYGDENEHITFKVYDHGTGKEYTANEQFSFQTNASYGTPDETYPVTVNSTTGNELIGAPFILHPNPTSRFLYISHQRGMLDHLTVINMVGREMMSLQNYASEHIDVSALEAGVYFLRITDGNQTFVYRFIKN